MLHEGSQLIFLKELLSGINLNPEHGPPAENINFPGGRVT